MIKILNNTDYHKDINNQIRLIPSTIKNKLEDQIKINTTINKMIRRIVNYQSEI